MAKEIERKFLVTGDSWRPLTEQTHEIRQAYLSTNPDATIRVRIIDSSAFLTVKSRNRGAVRNEWEYPISLADAEEMLENCGCSGQIAKTRHIVGPWEIDEFHGALEGLVVAEIELSDAAQRIDIPDFIGREVTDDSRYYNSVLSMADELPPVI